MIRIDMNRAKSISANTNKLIGDTAGMKDVQDKIITALREVKSTFPEDFCTVDKDGECADTPDEAEEVAQTSNGL